MSRCTLLVLALAAAIMAAACAPNRGPYAPVQITSAEAIPPDSPRGAVRLARLGLPRLASNQQRAVHLRMMVANRSSQPWTIRQAEQRIELNTGERIYPTTPAGEPVPVVEVPPQSTAKLDLFFPLPPAMQSARLIEAFDAVWTIRIDAVAVTERSAFGAFRTEVEQATPTGADPFATPEVSGMPSASAP